MADESFRLIVRQGIKPGMLDEFKKLAAEYTAPGSKLASPPPSDTSGSSPGMAPRVT
jgi:hypothetical protein